jgi:hypothetical protein
MLIRSIGKPADAGFPFFVRTGQKNTSSFPEGNDTSAIPPGIKLRLMDCRSFFSSVNKRKNQRKPTPHYLLQFLAKLPALKLFLSKPLHRLKRKGII